jgi:hypothetical protein
MIYALLFLIIIALWLTLAGLSVYGMILSFKKKWYIGLAAIVVPLFAFVIGTAKVVFKKDLLK